MLISVYKCGNLHLERFSIWMIGENQMKIILAGDSTVANCPQDEAPMAGWGQYLSNYVSYPVLNHAKGGSTTQSFVQEDRWDMVCQLIEPKDVVCIQFGHNDQKPEHKIYSEDYYQNISQMVKDVQTQGGRPILLTPPERNNFFRDRHFPTLEKEATIIQTVAKEQGIPCLPLHTYTKESYAANGEHKNRQFFVWLEPGQSKNYPRGYRDNTHFTEKGARWLASWIGEQLQVYLTNE